MSGGWVEHNLLLLKQAAVTSPGKSSGNASRPGRIERCSIPEFLHRSRACQQGTRPEPASCPSGPALARHACTPGLCRWEGMHPAALEITSPLGVRPCRMAMASLATPQVRKQLRTARWKTIADIASPMKRRDQGLPLVTCHGFSPPTLFHTGPRFTGVDPCDHRSDPARSGRPSLLVLRMA